MEFSSKISLKLGLKPKSKIYVYYELEKNFFIYSEDFYQTPEYIKHWSIIIMNKTCDYSKAKQNMHFTFIICKTACKQNKKQIWQMSDALLSSNH